MVVLMLPLACMCEGIAAFESEARLALLQGDMPRATDLMQQVG